MLADYHAGFGAADITPPIGVDLTGFIARENPSRAVRDPLWARAAALEAGAGRVLVVGLDCLGLDGALAAQLRGRLAQEFGLPSGAISLWCSHTHSGPATVRLIGCGRRNPSYLRGRFTEGIVGAAQMAMSRLAPARASWSECDGADWHHYRRPESGGLASDAAIVDHRARALWVESYGGRTLGCLWFYTAHATLLCTQSISGDWPGDAARRIESQTGAVALFGQGCAGDVAPAGEPNRQADVLRLGRAVGDGLVASRAHARAMPITACRWAAAARLLPLARPLSPGLLRAEWRARRTAMRRAAAGTPARTEAAMTQWARRQLACRAPARRRVELQVLRLGGLAIAAVPFEPLSAVGAAIRARLGGGTVTVGYANGCHSYLAMPEQYPVGGYEISQAYRWYGMASNYTPDAAEGLVRAIEELAAVSSPRRCASRR